MPRRRRPAVSTSIGQTNPRDVVRNQLLAGELPLALGYLFPEVRALRALRDDARAAFSEAIVELTDGQGLPHARLLPVFGPLFACWTRARWLGQHMKRGAWSRAAELQYEWLVRHAIRLADADGRFLLSSAGTGGASGTRGSASCDGSHWSGPLFETALKLAGDRGDHAAAAVALPRGIVPQRRKVESRRLAAALAQFRLGRHHGHVQRLVAVGRTAGRVLCRRSTDNRARRRRRTRAGRQLDFAHDLRWQAGEADGEWEQLCWESGKQFDFLELGLTLSDGLRLERQLLFGRDDRILVFCRHRLLRRMARRDSFNIRSACRLRTAYAGIPKPILATASSPATKLRAAVMPLALARMAGRPARRIARRKRRPTACSRKNQRRGALLPAVHRPRPQTLDQRTHLAATHRRRNLEIVPDDVAVGYRAQSGDDQWLIYRSLGTPGNRTLLGHNIAGEFCAGRFLERQIQGVDRDRSGVE